MTLASHRLALAVAVEFLAPLAAILVLLFGGEAVRPCLALRGCGGPIPGPVPIIGTTSGLISTLLVLGLGWLLAAGVLVSPPSGSIAGASSASRVRFFW